jgi:Leucine-rich repeat (LRR) protein
MEEITELDLKGRTSKELPETLKLMPNLKKLIATNTYYINVDNLKYCINLQELNLNYASAHSGKDVQLPLNLEKLTIHNQANHHKGNGVSLINCIKLYYIQLNNERIGSLSPNIKILILGPHCSTTVDIFMLNTLIELIIDDCTKIKTITPHIRHMENLTVFKHTNCGLEVIPPEIGELKNLEIVDFSSNRIKELPRSLFALPKLREIYASNNRLSSIFDGVTITNSLIKAVFSQNEIVNISKDISYLNILEHLDVSYNFILELPAEIHNLGELNTLLVGNNLISSIPRDIIYCTKLTRMDITNTKITKLPYFMVQTGIKHFTPAAANPLLPFGAKYNTPKGIAPIEVDRLSYGEDLQYALYELFEHINPFKVPDYANDIALHDITKARIKANMSLVFERFNYQMLFIAFWNNVSKYSEAEQKEIKDRLNSDIEDPIAHLLVI